MRRFAGRYYDGTSSRALPVEVTFAADGEVRIEGAGLERRQLLQELRASPRLGRTPRRLELPDGASLELADSDALEDALAPLATRGGRLVTFLERHWRTAALALAATALALYGSVRFAIPALADRVARRLPESVDARLGQGTLEALDQGLFAPSELDEPTRERLRARFAELRAEAGASRSSLLFRSGQAVGANAFALPSGIVIVTDDLVELAEDDDAVAAVLAHELGHVAHRHAIRAVLRETGVVILLTAALGDFVSLSSMAAAFPLLFLELEYSRSFEREADAFGAELLERTGVPRGALAEMLERLEEAAPESPWSRYLSTHPSASERAREIRGADG